MKHTRSLVWFCVAVSGFGLSASRATAQVTCSSSEWTAAKTMLQKRGEHATAAVGGKLYIMGGIFDTQDGPDNVEVYDPADDTWTQLSDMSVPRHHFTGAVYGDEIWVTGGKTDSDASGVVRVDVYDTTTDTWRQAPDLPAVQWGGPAVIVGDKLHVIGGSQRTTQADLVDFHRVLDLTNEAEGWSDLAPLPVKRVHVAGVELNGKIHILGGEISHSHLGDRDDHQIYDPATNTWTTGAPIPEARSHHEWATFTYAGKIISVSGVDSSKKPVGQESIYVYDPSIDTWSRMMDLPAKLVSPGARVINDNLYVTGGGVNSWFDGTLRDVWCLDVSSMAAAVTLEANIQLQGAWSDAGMKTDLVEADLLPLTSPYSADETATVSQEFLDAHPEIVDWVAIELRTGLEAGTKVARRSVFVTRDGSLLATDGTASLTFSGVVPGVYYVALYHRNHLAVIGSSPVDFSSGSGSIDFSNLP